MLPNVSFDDFDTEAPSNINDVDMDECMTVLRQCTADIVTDTSLQRFLLGALRPRYDMVRRMNGMSAPMLHDEIIVVTSDILGACRQHKALIKGVGVEADFRHNMADLLLRRFLLHLHRPLASRAGTPLQFYSRKMTLDAAMAILSPVPNPAFTTLTSVGAGMFKNRMIHTSLALASELLRELEENASISNPTGYRKMVVDAVGEAHRQTGERVRLGHTNADVKMYMKQSMVLCQAESTASSRSGSSLQRLAQAAKDSLETYYATLRARSGEPLDRGNMVTSQDVDQQEFSFDSELDFEDLFGTIDFNVEEALGQSSTLAEGMRSPI